MADQITHYKVFVASPGGLESERKAFKNALLSHNDADAIERSCFFQPIGWEITLGGVGRPQEKINQDLKKCDYFVLLLWNRWGSPTGRDDVTSGTHEEFMLANELLNDSSAPMREIVVFFRGVDAALLSDPGPQLQKVLDFKRQIEEEKRLLFETFDSPESFGEKLKRHLASWTRLHESAGKEPFPAEEVATEVHDEAVTVAEAETQTNPTELESELAFNMTTLRTMFSFDRYGKFLSEQERYVDAERVYREMYQLALDTNEATWASTAMARLGGTYRSQGKIHEAEQTLKHALGMKREQGDQVGESMTLTFLADIYYRQGKTQNAIEHYLAALGANPDLREPALSMIKYKTGRAYADIGDTQSAAQFLNEARDGASKSNNKKLLMSINQARKARKIG